MDKTLLISQQKIICKIATGYREDHTTGCLLDYLYFKEYFKKVVIVLSQQQAFNADPKAIQQINFTGNLTWNEAGNTAMSFIIEEAKETILSFPQGILRVL